MSKAVKHAPDPNLKHLVPFGPYGAGQWTAHPIGLVIVLGFMAMGLAAMPETRWLLLGSAAGGAILGFFLWLRHR
jgi:hypothetical protein